MGDRPWSKAKKVSVVTSAMLVGGGGLGYIIFLRATDVGETLALEPEIQRKAKLYGMFETRDDFERGLKVAGKDASSDFRFLCRTEFYLGADHFPQGATFAEVARWEDRFWAAIPKVHKAWKLRIQYAAILAYESGQNADTGQSLFESQGTFENEVSFSGEWSKMASFWAIPRKYQETKLFDDIPKDVLDAIRRGG